MQMLEFARSNRLPFTWRDPERADALSAPELAGLDASSLPLVRLPGGAQLRAQTTGQVSRALGIGRELEPREESTWWSSARGRRPRRRGLRHIRGTRHADHREHGARRAGGRLPADRELPRIPSRDERLGADKPCGHASAKVRRPVGNPPTARFRAKSETDARPANGGRPRIAALAVALATGAQYRRLPVEGLSRYEGVSVFYAAGPPEAQLCGAERVAVVGGGNSAGQAAVWSRAAAGSSRCCTAAPTCARR